MKMSKTGWILTVVLGFALSVGVVTANNLSITNVSVEGHGATTALVKFDISWDNSWRFAAGGDSLYFHDAAWVFFKVKLEGAGDWQHVKLEGTGINPPGFNIGTGTAIEMVVPADGAGMFVRRSSDGAGSVAVEQVTAVWNFAANGFSKNDKVKMQAMGIEMCYVAEGPFKVGDGKKDAGQLYEGGTGANPQPTPFAITSADAIECGDSEGKLWGASQAGASSMGGPGTIPADFPNGYNAFYCMKYAVTQGQYADFLNSLTRVQQTARCTATTVGNYMSDVDGGHAAPQNRNTVQLIDNPGDPQPRRYATVTPDRACNWLCWPDLTAFSDWSGLRPMSELEFEKACRGPLNPVAGEYAWGTTVIKAQTGYSSDPADGSGCETALPVDANCCYDNKMGGPVRVGIFARAGSTREAAGASYWGIMELSGNVWERPVSIGNTAGRAFTGLHGNGVLAANGDADVSNWPNATATGTGFRGGSWNSAASDARASDRNHAAGVNARRFLNYGGRAARSASSGVD